MTRGRVLRAARLVDRGLGAVEALFLWAACSCLAVMLAINVINLAYRNITGEGFSWAWAWTGVLFIWSVFLSFFVMYRRELDIKVVFFLERMGRHGQVAVQFLSALCAVIVMLLIVAETPQVFQRQVGELAFVGLQRYVLSIPLLLSSFLLAIHFINETVILILDPTMVAVDTEIPKW